MKKNSLKALLLFVLTLLPAWAAEAQTQQQLQQIPQLPIDSAVRYGVLPNGLTYYVRANGLPKERVNFYIAQKVGSVQEEESQRGLAHFLEHMCFNGTDHFPGNSLISFCERIGVKFGQNLNAYTSTDETVYNIDDVPVSDSNIDSCLLILRDWADGLTLAEPEIDKERGVIHEEWRTRTSGDMRIIERSLPMLYPGSRYGERLPIGLMSVIDSFKPAELRAYYEKWYRPDLQGIIVVGDIDADRMEARIKEVFSSIKMPENPAAYEHYPVPDNNEAIYVIDKDKELKSNSISFMYKHDPMPEALKNTQMYMAQSLLTSLASMAVNSRLNELSQQADCPFLGAGVSYGGYILSKTKDALSVGIMPKPGKDLEAVKAVMEEIERAARYGFNDTEIIRAREEFLSRMQGIYESRDQQYHNFYTKQYVRHFLENDPIPSLEMEYNLYKTMAPQLPTEAFSEVFKQLTASTDTNFVCLATYMDKEGVKVPTADELKGVVKAARAAELKPYVDNVKSEPLVSQLPAKGKIVKETAADFGYTCWTLQNGARVFFKKTDFNDSQVLFNATSFGGKSKVGNDRLVTMGLHDAVINASGIGNFNSVELEKKLAGKRVSCAVSMGQLTEGLSGSAMPKDLRTLFELIYLRFQQPADDPDAYRSLLATLKTQLANVEKLPDAAFNDSLVATIYGHNPRMARLHLADLEKADYEDIKRLYAERFQNGGDFDFFFTGAIDVDSLRLFTEQYIAPLKAQTSREKYDEKAIVRPVKGDVTNHFRRAMETPQASILQYWHGDLKYNLKNAEILNALGSILTQRYLKSIREDGGMAYSVGASAEADYAPEETYMLQIYCPVKPALRDSALLLMEQGIEDIARNGVTEEELNKVKQFELKDYDDSQRKNSYWHNLVMTKSLWGQDLQAGRKDVISALTPSDIQNFVKKTLLKQKNRIIVSMLPEDMKE